MLLTPYDAVVTRGLNMGPTVHQLSLMLITNQLKYLKHPKESEYLIAVLTDKSDIPLFKYPLLVKPSNMKPTYCLDLRLHTRGVRVLNGELQIEEGTPASALVELTQVMDIWSRESGRCITFNNLPIKVYSRWVAEAIGRKLGLSQVSPDVVDKLYVLFACFYSLSYIDTDKIHVFNVDDFSSSISRTTGYNFDFVKSIVSYIAQDLTQIRSLGTVCEFIRNMKWSPRLDRFSLRDLHMIMVSTGWFGGPDAKELLIVGLEYPPIFLTMLHTALENRSYKDTGLSQIARRFVSKNHDVNDYLSKYSYFVTRG